ncbi:hypothetical protein O6H91_Y406200 [Diphasiastrum complanatum]|nr:hypothetical protein O6H91_Y406200 [Diphasiastrum complanatum]
MQVSLPRLLGMTWDVKNENTISESSKDIATPRAVISLKVKDYNTKNGSEQDVNFQVTRERLNVMLESLHNVRDQLASISF